MLPRYAGQRPVTTACIKQHSCLLMIMIMIMRSINLLLLLLIYFHIWFIGNCVCLCVQGCVSVIHWARTVRHVTPSLSSAPVNPACEIPSVTAVKSTTGVCPRSPKATAAVCVSLSSSHYKTSLKLRYARLCVSLQRLIANKDTCLSAYIRMSSRMTPSRECFLYTVGPKNATFVFP